VPVLSLLFLGQEFCYYGFHRAAHPIRFFWASHAAAYRLGWTRLTGSGLCFTPLVAIGVHPRVVLAMFSLLYQFWIHNTWTPRPGWLESSFDPVPDCHPVLKERK